MSSSWPKPSTIPHKPAKAPRNRVPAPQRERILQKHVTGKSIKQISKEEHRNRETVSKIVHGPEMQDFVRGMRERFFGLGLDAISAVQHALREERDGRLGFQLLASIGVVPSQEEKQLLTAPPPEPESDEDKRVAKIVLDLMKCGIERANAFGFRLPEVEESLKKVGGRINYEKGTIEPTDPEENHDSL